MVQALACLPARQKREIEFIDGMLRAQRFLDRTFDRTKRKAEDAIPTASSAEATEARARGQDLYLPLNAHPSAWDLDPTLRPSATQSAIAVCTEEQYCKLSPEHQHELSRHRCVQIKGVKAYDRNLVSPLEFTPQHIYRYRSPHAPCSIQGKRSQLP